MTLIEDYGLDSPARSLLLTVLSIKDRNRKTEMDKLHIQKVMNYTNGNKTETAKLLNIAVTTLYRKLEEYKIG